MALAGIARRHAAYAGLVALLRVRFNANEILTSLMLNYVAQYSSSICVAGAWRDPEGFGFPQTAMFSPRPPRRVLVEGTRLHLGVAVALASASSAALVLWRTSSRLPDRACRGRRRARRGSPASARTRLVAVAMLISGGLAGLAGLFEVAGPIGQLTPQISPGYGYTAIIVAFLGRLHPLGVLFAGSCSPLSYLGGEAAQIELALARPPSPASSRACCCSSCSPATR